MDKYRFELTGNNALLMHRDDVESADALKAWRDDPENKKVRVAGDDRSPAWTWQTYLYHDGERVAMPSENIMVALRLAGAKITMSKQTTFKAASQSGLIILDEFCEFHGSEGPIDLESITQLQTLPFAEQAEKVKALGFKLSVKRATVGNAKHVRVRPRFDTWKVVGTVQIIDPVISPQILMQMFDLAGRYAGLGDWRPSSPKKPGPFGVFEAKVSKAK